MSSSTSNQDSNPSSEVQKDASTSGIVNDRNQVGTDRDALIQNQTTQDSSKSGSDLTSDSKTPQTYTEQIQSTVSSAYQSLPTLSGVAAAVGLGSLVGGTESTNADTQVAQDQDQTSKENDVNETETEQTNDGDDRSLKERARAESLAAGPSCRSRVGKDQTAIGTETAIPTTAGPGTTLSPDLDAQKASKNAKSSKAVVPNDYEPCLMTAGGSTAQQALATDKAEETGTEVEEADGDENGDEDGNGNGKRGFGEKLKNKIKGQSKVIKGTLTNNQDDKNMGRAIKKGVV